MRVSGPTLRKAGRRLVGFGGEWFFKAWGAAGAANVLIGPADSLGAKLLAAGSGVVGFVGNIRHVWYALRHQEEIRNALVTINDHMPTVDQIVTTADGVQRISDRFGAITDSLRLADEQYDQISGISVASLEHFIEALRHIANARALMPDTPELEQIASASRTATDVLSTISSLMQQVDYARIYALVANIASNVGPAEMTTTLLVGGLSIVVGAVAGKYTSRYWARRGRPHLFDRWIENRRFRHDREYFVGHLEEEFGPEVYETTRQHFFKKFREEEENGERT